MINIAIDGYAGSGKSTLVKLLAEKLDGQVKILDTGAIFRGFAYAFCKYGVEEPTAKDVKEFLKKTSLKVEFVDDKQHIIVNGEDATDFIRTEQISVLSSKLSVFPEVRAKYLVIAQTFANQNGCIMEGRDIGTVVMPHADVKIFLTANEETRAKRRLNDLKAKNPKVTFEEVLKDMQERDYRDTHKGDASLRVTDESVVVDNSEMSLDETADYCMEIINKHIGKKDVVNITIDGYVCSGKSTIARALAKRLKFNVFDTGAVYRGIACAFDYMKLDENKIDEAYIENFAKQINVKVEFIDDVEHVYVNGIDWTGHLRTERISALVAKISPFMCIREKVLKFQREFARTHNLVMEGRDIGSFVLPHADFKFFTTADEKVRAKRRFEQQKAMGNDVSFAKVLKELQQRDYSDTHRDHGELKMVKDSILVDTTNQSLEQSVEFCLDKIRAKRPDIKIY